MMDNKGNIPGTALKESDFLTKNGQPITLKNELGQDFVLMKSHNGGLTEIGFGNAIVSGTFQGLAKNRLTPNN